MNAMSSIAVAALSLSALTVRDATDADMEAVQSIYAFHVLHGIASFEEAPPSAEDMRARRQAVLALGLPYLVAEQAGSILGYSYAGPYRARPAYRHTIENSVYVRDGAGGRGIGMALLQALLARCHAGPWRQMIAVIGDSDNAGSISLHRKAGFAHVGVMRSVGFKHGRWVDTVIMQLPLGQGDRSLPGP
ncbi:N-acyltransferase YncA [Pigmentiphaga humi]|uniref:N-acyltransferase YncA n=1 Tax=Pigmentiphaga humi TaxID=2478468 RepID=A0A3P4B6F3_9BURK|nr:GNAT family N-acetyltransferase [Pigmentiphaga humi]VCU71511.1 N-acyltransferase YncA [Pigmentiphaga humi]